MKEYKLAKWKQVSHINWKQYLKQQRKGTVFGKERRAVLRVISRAEKKTHPFSLGKVYEGKRYEVKHLRWLGEQYYAEEYRVIDKKNNMTYHVEKNRGICRVNKV